MCSNGITSFQKQYPCCNEWGSLSLSIAACKPASRLTPVDIIMHAVVPATFSKKLFDKGKSILPIQPIKWINCFPLPTNLGLLRHVARRRFLSQATHIHVGNLWPSASAHPLLPKTTCRSFEGMPLAALWTTSMVESQMFFMVSMSTCICSPSSTMSRSMSRGSLPYQARGETRQWTKHRKGYNRKIHKPSSASRQQLMSGLFDIDMKNFAPSACLALVPLKH